MEKEVQNVENQQIPSAADYVPTGHQNAISRKFLSKMTGLNDRQVRQDISDSDLPIINIGNGYYIPDMNDPADISDMRSYVCQEMARVHSLQSKISSKFAQLAPDLCEMQPDIDPEEPDLDR